MPQKAHLRAIELFGDVDESHTLHVEVPLDVPPGQVRLLVLMPAHDDAGARWAEGVAREWAEELADTRQDIYTLDDGQPIDGPR